MHGKACLLALLGLVAFGLHASEARAPTRAYSDQYFAIDLPAGYLEPVEHASGNAISRGFRKPYPSGDRSTVILVSVSEMGPSFAKRAAAERGTLTLETLEPIVASLESNRTGFRKSAPRAVTISGHRGLRVSWSGSAQGVAFEGVVYCIGVGPRAYAVQVQDPSGLGNARLNEALQAVERMRLR